MLTPITNTTMRYAVMVSRRKLKREEQRIYPLNACHKVCFSLPKVVK